MQVLDLDALTLSSGSHKSPSEGHCLLGLSNGGAVIVDRDDEDRLSRHVWHRDTNGYARAMLKIDGRWKLVRMHRLLTQAPPDLYVDHIDCNRLNNTRANLRLCTPQQSVANIAKYRGQSRFKGVHWHKGAGKWMSQIKVAGRHVYLGLFENEEIAAAAYERAAKSVHGEFARAA